MYSVAFKADVTVTQAYGVKDSDYALGYHAGIDLVRYEGAPIYAVGDGYATVTWGSGQYGNNVYVDHGNGTKTHYSHLSNITIGNGNVSRGQQIGNQGSTGWSSGSHLDFELWKNGSRVDPTVVAKDGIAGQVIAQMPTISVTRQADPSILKIGIKDGNFNNTGDAPGYIVVRKNTTSNGTGQIIHNTGLFSGTATITGVSNTEKICVFAELGMDWGGQYYPKSNIIWFEANVVMPKVTAVRDASDPTKVTVTWTKGVVPTKQANYLVARYVDGSSQIIQWNANFNEAGQHVFTGVNASKDVNIFAESDTNASGYYNSNVVTLNKIVPTMPTVTAVRLANDPTSVKITWTAGMYTNIGTSMSYLLVRTGTVNNAVGQKLQYVDLTKAGEYTITGVSIAEQVVAFAEVDNQAGGYFKSNVVTLAIPRPELPTINVNRDLKDPTIVYCSWTAGKYTNIGVAKSYMLARINNTQANQKVTTCDFSKTGTITFTGVSITDKVYIYGETERNSGLSYHNSNITILDPSVPVMPVITVQRDASNASKLVITWSAGKYTGAPKMTNYMLIRFKEKYSGVNQIVQYGLDFSKAGSIAITGVSSTEKTFVYGEATLDGKYYETNTVNL